MTSQPGKQTIAMHILPKHILAYWQTYWHIDNHNVDIGRAANNFSKLVGHDVWKK